MSRRRVLGGLGGPTFARSPNGGLIVTASPAACVRDTTSQPSTSSAFNTGVSWPRCTYLSDV